MSTSVVVEKRRGGQSRDGVWLVITESIGEEGVEFTHFCGEKIMAVMVSHPVWDDIFPCSGSGKVRQITTPYCPKCEEEPSTSGSIIHSKD